VIEHAVALDFLSQTGFWIGVGIIAGYYTIFALGLQLNVGYTGILNFGQAGFMAVGAYAMGMLVVKAGFSFWLALPVATLIAMAFGVLIGLPSLRLRADYFAIVTISFAEIIRIATTNAISITGGSEGLSGYETSWDDTSDSIQESLETIGWGDEPALPLLLVVGLAALILIVLLSLLQRTPWGRVLRAVREDEDAARALGKNVFSYKLQSLALGAALAAIAGYFLAVELATLFPDTFEPLFTFIGYGVLVLGGLASYPGVAAGSVVLWAILEGTRFIDLPLVEEKVEALRFMLVGVLIILLMVFRPQGMFGKRQEMVLGE
jgi:branched-chain amino acid transport system permease protein